MNRKKSHTIFLSSPLIFNLEEKVLEFKDFCVSWSSPKADMAGAFGACVFCCDWHKLWFLVVPVKILLKFISKIFKKITNNHRLCQSQQQTQATDIQEEEIKMRIDLTYVKGTSKKLSRMLRSHKIRSTFYTGSTLHKLLCKPKI